LKNSEQDWLKTNLAKFTRMLQGQRDLLAVAKMILSELAPVVGAQHGVFYMVDASEEEPRLKLLASYAYRSRKNVDNFYKLGEGAPPRAAERRSGAQERRGRAGPPGARGEGDAARPHLQVQVRVPRQHVARAAHATQLAPDPRRSAGRQLRGQPHVEAGRLREDDPLLGER